MLRAIADLRRDVAYMPVTARARSRSCFRLASWSEGRFPDR